MNVVAAKMFAEGFLKGYADVIGAMLSSEPEFTTGNPEEAAPESVEDALSGLPLIMQAEVNGGGAIVFMTTLEDARGLVSAVMGDEPPTGAVLGADEAATMKEIFDPCMGGGVSHFKEKYDKVIELQPTSVRLAAEGESAALMQALEAGAILVPCSYEVPTIVEDGQGALFFSQALEGTIPAEESGMDDEVQDIVQESFGTPPPQGPASASREMPGNINMILDIGLTVTARLGRIEMPLGQVLELGPGSIIEVGHSVDEPVELLVNNKLIARGDVVVVEEKFGLRITEIVSPSERIESLR